MLCKNIEQENCTFPDIFRSLTGELYTIAKESTHQKFSRLLLNKKTVSKSKYVIFSVLPKFSTHTANYSYIIFNPSAPVILNYAVFKPKDVRFYFSVMNDFKNFLVSIIILLHFASVCLVFFLHIYTLKRYKIKCMWRNQLLICNKNIRREFCSFRGWKFKVIPKMHQ